MQAGGRLDQPLVAERRGRTWRCSTWAALSPGPRERPRRTPAATSTTTSRSRRSTTPKRLPQQQEHRARQTLITAGTAACATRRLRAYRHRWSIADRS